MSIKDTINHRISPSAKSYDYGHIDRFSGGLVLYLIAGFAIFQGAALLLWGGKGSVLTIGAAYMYFVFRWPHLALIATIVIIFDGLGFINPETFLRVPGVFKLRDLVFVSLFVPLLLNTKWHSRARSVFQRANNLLFPIMVILFLTTFQMVRTSFEHNLPLNTCIMAGRHYWYYAFVPLVAIYLDTSQKRKVIYRLFLVVISTLASVVIIQTLVYAVFGMRLVSPHVQFGKVYWGSIQSFSRMYLVAEPTLVLGFALAFWGAVVRKSPREKLVYAALTLLCALAILLTNARMRWAHTLLVVLIPVFALGRHIPKTRRQLLGTLALLLFILISLFVLSGLRFDFLSGVGARVVSAWTDVRDKKGTWEYRVEDSRFRIQLIREHPLFGIGFVHIDHAPQFGGLGKFYDEEGRVSGGQAIATMDSGIVTLLVHFGAMGGLWALWYFFSVLGFCFRMLRSTKSECIHWTSIPLIGYVTGGLVTFVTLGLFTMPGDIAGHSFALGMLASGLCVKLRLDQSVNGKGEINYAGKRAEANEF